MTGKEQKTSVQPSVLPLTPFMNLASHNGSGLNSPFIKLRQGKESRLDDF